MGIDDAGGSRCASRPPVSPISVLIVDDHAVFADALQARLSREPDLAPVDVGYSVNDGRTWISREQPDIAVLDLGLTDGTGLDLATYIADVSPTTSVLILSAMEPVDSAISALRIGVRAWLPKTIDTAHLVRAIRGVQAGEAWISPALLGRVLTGLLAQPPDPLSVLTSREREILERMVAGSSRADIAIELGVSANTVRTHAQNLMAKLGAHSALEAVSIAMRNGLGGVTG